ncbi:hypothetical protein CFAM422_000578 [Trichoderma lentiforme]|uniref:Uncharacterized protein n=1 Tax=Trichoderma lentiforme TaxID=1567552 RepID=A0A9P4XMM7_9HYPO|nr:hypothetical protein CFAM422_000578 [Trichoderma lentiforme]
MESIGTRNARIMAEYHRIMAQMNAENEALKNASLKENAVTTSKNGNDDASLSENGVSKTGMSQQSSDQVAEPSSRKRRKLDEKEISEATKPGSKVKLDDRIYLELEELKLRYNALHTAHQELVKVHMDRDAETGRLIRELNMKLDQMQSRVERRVDRLDLKQWRNEQEVALAMETNQEKIMTKLDISYNSHEREFGLLRREHERLEKQTEKLKEENLKQKEENRKLEERMKDLEDDFNGFRAEHTWKVGKMWKRMLGME